jgi:hypothetical protein
MLIDFFFFIHFFFTALAREGIGGVLGMAARRASEWQGASCSQKEPWSSALFSWDSRVVRASSRARARTKKHHSHVLISTDEACVCVCDWLFDSMPVSMACVFSQKNKMYETISVHLSASLGPTAANITTKRIEFTEYHFSNKLFQKKKLGKHSSKGVCQPFWTTLPHTLGIIHTTDIPCGWYLMSQDTFARLSMDILSQTRCVMKAVCLFIQFCIWPL